MNVIVDIEWIQNEAVPAITQLAAVRFSDGWEAVDVFERLVCPDAWWDTDWEHKAYTGYSPEEFRAGDDEKTCISDFLCFIKDDDIILCWQENAEQLLKQKVRRYTSKPLFVKFECVRKAVFSMVNARGVQAHDLYEAAESLGAAAPALRHQAISDVLVMQWLLSELGYKVNPFPDAGTETSQKRKTRAEKNADILSRAQYNFVYSPDSKVFHRKSCHLILNARVIQGCVYYEKAAKMRAPCKVCRPEPIEQAKAALAAETAAPIKKKVIYAKLLGGNRVRITNSELVGTCYNKTHPGKLTRKLMEKHDCIGKKCVFFKKNENSDYWTNAKRKKLMKEERKKEQQIKKRIEDQTTQKLEELKALFQSYADEAGYEMLIVRLEKVYLSRYRVFYVSNNSFADGNRFPEFLASIKSSFPMYSVQLAHIKAVDGHFVTIPEFLSRRK